MIKEKALLIFIDFSRDFNRKQRTSGSRYTIENNIQELSNLAVSAGADVAGCLSYKQKAPNPRFFISTGRLEEIASFIAQNSAGLVIFDDEITPTQQRNLQRRLDVKVIDRTALILDIFAQRANSSEGKLQVELAQLDYLLPRLIGRGVELSRLGGGIGTRGPGETKLEVDRRKIRDRIASLRKKMDQISVQRDTQRKSRKGNIFQIALAGYTNSGKSTLLNSLTDSDIYARNMLFSTLDSTTRKLDLDVKPDVLVTDTVGFIEKLPHQLIAAFKSTLEEVKISDFLLLVVDISNEDFQSNIRSVKKVLEEIDVWGKPFIMVFNKIDRIEEGQLAAFKLKYRNSIFISALKKIGLEELRERIKDTIERHNADLSIMLPYEKQDLISFIYEKCRVINRKDMEKGIRFDLKIEPRYINILKPYGCLDRKTRSIS